MDTNSAPQNTAKPKRFRLRFSLRTALVAMLLTALGASYLVRPTKEYRQETALRRRIEDLDGTVEVAVTKSGGLGKAAAIVRRLGGGELLKQFDERITSVGIYYKQVTEDDLKAIAKCSHLQELDLLEVGLTDESLQIISTCSELKKLNIRFNSKVTDVGAQSLKNLNLNHLDVVGTRISNACFGEVLDGYSSLQESPELCVLDRSRWELTNKNFLQFDRANASSSLALAQATSEQLDWAVGHFKTYVGIRARFEYAHGNRYISVELLDSQFDEDLLLKLKQIYSSKALFNRLIVQCSGTDDEGILSRAAKLDVESLELAGVNVPRNFTLLRGSQNLTELNLPDATNIAREDFDSLAKIDGLRQLRVPNAGLSEKDLFALLASPPLNLEAIKLPDLFSHLRSRILESKLSKTVNFPSDSLLAKTWDDRFAKPIHENFAVNVNALQRDPTIINPAGQHDLSFFLESSGPGGETNTFGDFLVLTEIQGGVQSEHYANLLERISNRLSLTNAPIDQLADSPESWRSPVNQQPMSAFLLIKMWSALATTHISNGKMSEALDLGVRTLALWPTMELYEDKLLQPMFAGDLDVAYQAFADLCHLTHDTDETRKLKRLIFMVPEENEVTWEQPAKLIGPWDRIGILAPAGRELTQVKSDHDKLDIVIDGETRFRDKRQVDLPAGTKHIFVSPESFPLTVFSK